MKLHWKEENFEKYYKTPLFHHFVCEIPTCYSSQILLTNIVLAECRKKQLFKGIVSITVFWQQLCRNFAEACRKFAERSAKSQHPLVFPNGNSWLERRDGSVHGVALLEQVDATRQHHHLF